MRPVDAIEWLDINPALGLRCVETAEHIYRQGQLLSISNFGVEAICTVTEFLNEYRKYSFRPLETDEY